MQKKPPEKTITCRGETHTISEWSKIVGLSRQTIADRVRRGWPPEQAVFEPLKRIVKTPLKRRNGGGKCLAKNWKDCFTCTFDDCVREKSIKGEREALIEAETWKVHH